MASGRWWVHLHSSFPYMVLTKVPILPSVRGSGTRLHVEVSPDTHTQHINRADAGSPVPCKQAASELSVRASLTNVPSCQPP